MRPSSEQNVAAQAFRKKHIYLGSSGLSSVSAVVSGNLGTAEGSGSSNNKPPSLGRVCLRTPLRLLWSLPRQGGQLVMEEDSGCPVSRQSSFLFYTHRSTNRCF